MVGVEGEHEVDVYGAEDADEYGDKKGKRRSARQANAGDEGDGSEEAGRYGLRGRKKRVKMDKGAGEIGGDQSNRNYTTQ